MKNYYTKCISLSFLFIILYCTANAQSFAWARQAGSASLLDEGKAVGVDAAGNVYSAGVFGDSADFDPGANVFKLYSAGSEDIYIQKLDAFGNFIWAIGIGGATYDMVHDMYVDASGNVYITGQFTGTADFDPGIGVASLVSAGSDDIYLAKYTASGALSFVKKMGSTIGDAGRGIVLDASGNIYLTGYFRSVCDFDPSANVNSLTSVSGSADIFVAKYDSLGNYIWANAAGGTNGDIGQCITVDNSGNVIVAGDFYGTAIDFDPGAGTVSLSTNGFSDIFVAKYTSGGALVWARSMGGIVNDDGFGIAVDVSGNVYTAGYFQSIVDFDPGPGTTNLTALGEDIFIQKLTASGDMVWVKQIGGVNPDQALDLNISASGYLYVTGFFTSVVDFDPGAGIANLTGLGGQDVFIAKYDTAGAYMWAKGFGGVGFEQGNDIAIDANDGVATTGYFNSTVDFDPGSGVTSLLSLGSKDGFTQKMFPSGTSVPSKLMQIIRVYPNPTHDVISIDLQKQFTRIRLSLTDVSGTVLKEAAFDNSSNVLLNVADIVPGNYLLIIETDGKYQTAKITKQ